MLTRICNKNCYSLLVGMQNGTDTVEDHLAASYKTTHTLKISSVQLLSHIWLFVTPCTAACQASLSITNSWSLHKFMSVELVMPSNHLILCHPLLLLPSIFPSISVLSNESQHARNWWWTGKPGMLQCMGSQTVRCDWVTELNWF